jgi:hypothetical protein
MKCLEFLTLNRRHSVILFIILNIGLVINLYGGSKFIEPILSYAEIHIEKKVDITNYLYYADYDAELEKISNGTKHYDYTTYPPVPKKKIIVISAYYRSGSTLMGTLFDKNPNLLYYFEKLD